MKTYALGQLGGLTLTYDLSAVAGSMALWIGLSVVGVALLDLSMLEAVLGGLAGVALHWAGETIHQWGHARAARRTGYPMTGVHYFLLLGRSMYPADEGDLPGSIHIRRALGGPQMSFLTSILAGVIAAILYPVGGVVRYLALFFFVLNFFVFGLGAFLPLGFTDGSTLLYWWNR